MSNDGLIGEPSGETTSDVTGNGATLTGPHDSAGARAIATPGTSGLGRTTAEGLPVDSGWSRGTF